MDFDTFTVALLLRGDHPPDLSERDADALQVAHMAHLADLHETGVLLAAGPVLGPPERELRGLSILGYDPDEANVRVARDPGVTAGVFRHELHVWATPAGLISFHRGRLPRSMAEAAADPAPQRTAGSVVGLSFDTYVRGRPGQVWQALTAPALVPQWRFGMTFDTDWSRGSGLRSSSPDGSGRVLECEPGQRLVYDWTADEATTNGGLPSRVSFELAGMGDVTKLTARHDGLLEDAPFHQVVSGGWPMMLSSLKSLVETGTPLRFA